MPEADGTAPHRSVARLELDGEALELVELRITREGTRLVLVLPGARRMALAPGRGIEHLSIADLSTGLAGAVGLTGTEAVFTAPDGRRWLAQAVGPVWAGSEAAEGLVGTMFTSIDGRFERFEVGGSPLRPDREDPERVRAELEDLWRLRGESEERGGH